MGLGGAAAKDHAGTQRTAAAPCMHPAHSTLHTLCHRPHTLHHNTLQHNTPRLVHCESCLLHLNGRSRIVEPGILYSTVVHITKGGTSLFLLSLPAYGSHRTTNTNSHSHCVHSILPACAQMAPHELLLSSRNSTSHGGQQQPAEFILLLYYLTKRSPAEDGDDKAAAEEAGGRRPPLLSTTTIR